MNNEHEFVSTLRAQMSGVKLLDPDRPFYKAISATLDKADNKTLKIIYDAKIQFVSSMALNRLAARGVKL